MSDPLSFDAATPRHALPMLFAGQAQKEFFVNECLALLDVLAHPFVEAEVESPPLDPQTGQCWLVGEAPLGAFAAHAGSIACWDGSAWVFARPREGMTVRCRADGQRLRTATAWTRLAAPPVPSGGEVVDQAARDAIVTVIARLISGGIFCS